MKWALAGILFLTAIVVFSIAALDQKDVVWDGTTPRCPHCRSPVNDYANVCATCDTAFDWEVTEEYCDACLAKNDAKYYQGLARGREEEIRAALRGRVAKVQVDDLVAYALDLEAGECAFCGGTGDWIADAGPESGGNGGSPPPDVLEVRLREHLEGRCPVCFGDGSCILCGGDHLVVRGREQAARERALLERRLGVLSVRRDVDSSITWFRLVEDFVRRNEGRREIGSLPAAADPAGHQLDRARARLDLVREVLERLPARPEGS